MVTGYTFIMYGPSLVLPFFTPPETPRFLWYQPGGTRDGNVAIHRVCNSPIPCALVDGSHHWIPARRGF